MSGKRFGSSRFRCGIWYGVGFASVDLLLFLVLVLLGSGYLYWAPFSEPSRSALIGFWNLVHAPVNFILVPDLIGYVPSHGMSIESIFAKVIYVSACAIQMFIFGFLLGAMLKGKENNKRGQIYFF